MSDKHTTLSFAHTGKDLPRPERLYERAGSATKQFEQERCPHHAAQLSDQDKTESTRRESADGRDDFARAARRENFMIKRQKPQPVLRPSLVLSLGPDRAAFNKQWVDERIAARKRERKRSR